MSGRRCGGGGAGGVRGKGGGGTLGHTAAGTICALQEPWASWSPAKVRRPIALLPRCCHAVVALGAASLSSPPLPSSPLPSLPSGRPPTRRCGASSWKRGGVLTHTDTCAILSISTSAKAMLEPSVWPLAALERSGHGEPKSGIAAFRDDARAYWSSMQQLGEASNEGGVVVVVVLATAARTRRDGGSHVARAPPASAVAPRPPNAGAAAADGRRCESSPRSMCLCRWLSVTGVCASVCVRRVVCASAAHPPLSAAHLSHVCASARLRLRCCCAHL